MVKLRDFWKKLSHATHTEHLNETAGELDERPEIIIVVMGATGTGKSSLINDIIVTEAIKVGHQLASFTERIQTTAWTFRRKRIVFVDTPGFGDTTISDVDVFKMIAEYLEALYRRKVLVNGILYHHRITKVKLTGSTIRNLKLMEKLVGPGSLKNVLLVTTFWDRLHSKTDLEHAQELEYELKSEYWNALIDQGSKIYSHRNRTKASEIVDSVLKNQSETLDIQKELVDENRALINTSAGRALGEGNLRLIKMCEERLSVVQDSIKAVESEEGNKIERLRSKRSEKG